jgi:MutS-like protein
MKEPLPFYNENIRGLSASLKKINDRITNMALLRLFSFCAAAWFIYQSLSYKEPVVIVFAIASVILFFFSLRLAFNLRDKKNLTEKLLYLNKNEVHILGGKPNAFDNGIRYLDPLNYSADLDIFGSGSVYGLLNRTTTKHGSDALSIALQHALVPQEILSRQQAVQQLSTQAELRQQLTAQGLLHQESEGNLHDIGQWLKEPNRMLQRKWLSVTRWIIPAFNLCALYYLLDTGDQRPFLIGFLVAWIIIAIYSKYILSQHKLVTKKQAILDQYASILKVFGDTDAGDSKVLTQLKSDVADADKGVHRLARLSGMFDQRLNLVVLSVLNGILLYDIQCMMNLESWKSDYKDKFDNWIEIVGKIELLNSLAGFAFNNHEYTYPLVSDELSIEAVRMSHPLIPAAQNVPNSLALGVDEKLIVLTGSNMSGKTTFLRTVGVNLVLAQCGAPVNAEKFVFKPVNILSSIRVGDSLQENTSYFMAELKKLRLIVDALETGAPALVLIDEILRGTNSDDKTHGSEQFIRKLIRYNCLTMFATHDLSLGVLQQELSKQVNNYCFESIITDGQLIFDYTLQHGIARNKNASFLMEKMGIIER